MYKRQVKNISPICNSPAFLICHNPSLFTTCKCESVVLNIPLFIIQTPIASNPINEDIVCITLSPSIFSAVIPANSASLFILKAQSKLNISWCEYNCSTGFVSVVDICISVPSTTQLLSVDCEVCLYVLQLVVVTLNVGTFVLQLVVYVVDVVQLVVLKLVI